VFRRHSIGSGHASTTVLTNQNVRTFLREKRVQRQLEFKAFYPTTSGRTIPDRYFELRTLFKLSFVELGKDLVVRSARWAHVVEQHHLALEFVTPLVEIVNRPDGRMDNLTFKQSTRARMPLNG